MTAIVFPRFLKRSNPQDRLHHPQYADKLEQGQIGPFLADYRKVTTDKLPFFHQANNVTFGRNFYPLACSEY